MKQTTLLILAFLTSMALTLTACGPKEPPRGKGYQLTTAQHSSLTAAATSFFTKKILVQENGKTFSGELLSCSGSDSDEDGTVSCTGNVPVPQGNGVIMAERTIYCAYLGAAAGCKATK